MADDILRDERNSVHAGSFVESALPSEQDIVFLSYDVSEIEQRHAQIRQIENDIVEVAEMYKDLSAMVDEQQVAIDLVEERITSTRDQTEKAHQELQQAEQYQKAHRKKMCCVLFLVLGVVAAAVLIALGVTKQF